MNQHEPENQQWTWNIKSTIAFGQRTRENEKNSRHSLPFPLSNNVTIFRNLRHFLGIHALRTLGRTRMRLNTCATKFSSTKKRNHTRRFSRCLHFDQNKHFVGFNRVLGVRNTPVNFPNTIERRKQICFTKFMAKEKETMKLFVSHAMNNWGERFIELLLQ